MNAYSRTLPLAGAAGISPALRERGSSALDRRTTWAAPDPASMLFDPWGAPAAHTVIRIVQAPWPAPDASMRVAMAPPASLAGGVVTNIVEPFHPIEMPDLAAAQRVAVFDPPAGLDAGRRPWPPPTLADAAAPIVAAPAPSDRSGVRHRVALGLAAAAGVACAAVAAAVALL